jgi:hypothetical protein
MGDDLEIPAFLIIPQEVRNAAWKTNPPKHVPYRDEKLEAQKADRERQKKAETAARIERMKASLAVKARRPPKIDTTGMRWNVNRSRWEPQEDYTMPSDQVNKYNELAALAGVPLLTIKKFENKAIGASRIEKVQKMVDSKKDTVQATVSTESVVEEVPAMAKKAKKVKTNGAKKGNGEPVGKNKVILDLLQRKSGTTVADAIKATGWKTVHFSAHANKAKLTLRKERQKDGATRYWAE